MTAPHRKEIQAIRAACIAANPEIAMQETNLRTLSIRARSAGEKIEGWTPRPIRLADVLLAIDHNEDNPPALTSEGQFCQYNPENGEMHLSGEFWNLRSDNLEQQSDETISFLHNLICH